MALWKCSYYYYYYYYYRHGLPIHPCTGIDRARLRATLYVDRTQCVNQ